VYDMPAPSCCEGKASPCCDKSCLDRLALRECESRGMSTLDTKVGRLTVADSVP
jgi:hypothetical protein